MKVSVIVPVYNPGAYLTPCLDSIARQTLTDWECLCIDDGSTDGSAAVLDARAAGDPRFRVEHRKNAGAAASRNRGLERAQGEYVAFMDADDLYPSADVLQRLYDSAVAHGAAMCGGGMLLLGTDGVSRRWNEIGDGEDHGWQRPFDPEGFVSAETYGSVFGFTRFLYRLDLLRAQGISFPNYIRFEDPIFFVKALAAAGGFHGIGAETYCYRVDYRPKVRSAAILRDYVRAQIEVVRLASERNLSGVLDCLWATCGGQEMCTVVGETPRTDDDLFLGLCELSVLFRSRGVLKVMNELRVGKRKPGLVFRLKRLIRRIVKGD